MKKYYWQSKRGYEKMNTLFRAFDFYGVCINWIGYNYETKVFTLHNGEIELTRNNANKFIRKYRIDKTRYNNQKILQRV